MDIFTSLPDSLDSLGTFVGQLQWLIGLGIAHPIWAVVVVLLSIGTLQLLADLVKRGIQASLRFVVSLPFGISRWIWQRLPIGAASRQDRATDLLNRLDQLRAEEAMVLAELRGLVSKADLEKGDVEMTEQTTTELTEVSVD